MKILISGASGLIGKEIVNSLLDLKHQVIALQRTSPQETPYWDSESGVIELGDSQQIDVVINLAGES